MTKTPLPFKKIKEIMVLRIIGVETPLIITNYDNLFTFIFKF
ncbi:hypothetical protein SBF1_2900006 [Candidatus Desulfosporosinus infrequens]|uniref:Uncharacterized protein n=1 Tax=Candidatus Desulfosporosinus infrequens TaxID=2043169 RepID=A0A2U3KV43_9FIRM|nr:hypothetical protein SBF1_2900006 [Candidatus Desulfosporosinus infrequens]